MSSISHKACNGQHGRCASLPDLVRMNYFHGQLISERDLLTEQSYFRAKLRHANRCLHGYGVLCGLLVAPVQPPEDCPPEDDARRRKVREAIDKIDQQIEELGHKEKANADATDPKAAASDSAEIESKIAELQAEREKLLRKLESLGTESPKEETRHPQHLVEVSCGAAIDCEGNDIVLRGAATVDLDKLLACRPHDNDGGYFDHGHSQEQHSNQHQDQAKEQESSSHECRDEDESQSRYVYLSICYQECGREPTRPFQLDPCATSVSCRDARVVEGWKLSASYERPPEDERCDLCCSPCEEACVLLARIRIDKRRPIRVEDIDHSVRRRFGLYEPTVITGISWRHGFHYSFDTAHQMIGSKGPGTGLEIRFSRPVRASTLTLGVIEIWRFTGGRGQAGALLNMEAEYVGLPQEPDAMVDRIVIRNGSGERVQSNDRVMILVRTAFILDACCRPMDGAHLGGRVPRITDGPNVLDAALKEEREVPRDEACPFPPHGPVPWTTGPSSNFESWFYISEA